MFAQLPMYQRVGNIAFKKDLSNILLLSDLLGNPDKSFKSVHVAGTNGKGSTSHMLASVLQEAGYKVGLYTSPHLKDFRERIKINGVMISEEAVLHFVERYKSFFETNKLSFFEMTVGMAFDYFKAEEVDIAVIEVGLGGRLDSTNIIKPELSIITNIGLDHTQLLGDTLGEIAAEKAGIIKEGVPVLIGEAVQDTRFIFEQAAEQQLSDIYFAEEMELPGYDSDLKGAYQKRNIRTVIAALYLLRDLGWQISDKAFKAGLAHVIRNTGLLGRWQLLSESPKVICDTAHNREGLEIVIEQLQEEDFDSLHIVLGVVNDKNLERILDLFPKNAIYYYCKPDIPRGLEAETLKVTAAKYALTGDVYKSVSDALSHAKKNAGANDLIFVGGSTFTVAEVV